MTVRWTVRWFPVPRDARDAAIQAGGTRSCGYGRSAFYTTPGGGYMHICPGGRSRGGYLLTIYEVRR